MTRWLLVLPIVLATGCGSDGNDGPPSDNPGSGVTIRGGERMQWDQPADSPATASAYTYTLYVDGGKMSLTDTRCASVRSAAGVECSGRLPALPGGPHTLQLTASLNGVEGSRSAPLTVSVVAVAAQYTFVTSPDAVGLASHGPGVACAMGTPQDCHDLRRLVSVAGHITMPVASGELVLFVENATRIRAVIDDVLLEEPGLTLEDDARITALALPGDFEHSRAVFVAWGEGAPDGRESLNVTRYRELHGRLGEGATIVTGLPLPPGGPAPMVIDDRGFVYIALPVTGATNEGALAALGSFVLRFDSDGRVPADNSNGSPVLAHGYARPSSLVWDPVWRDLWLSGTDPRWPGVSRLPIEVDGRAEWPLRLVSVSSKDAAVNGAALAVTAERTLARLPQLWRVRDDGVVERAIVRPQRDPLQFDRLDLGAIDPVVAIGQGPARDLLLVTRPAPGPADTESILWRLTPRP